MLEQPYLRVHPKLKDALQPARPGHILDQKQHNYIRKLQLAYMLEHKQPLTNRLIVPTVENGLTWPVMIGEKGEAIAIYEKEPLGKGASGTVYLGVNLDTGTSHAVKYQRTKKGDFATVTAIRHEDGILQNLAQLVDRIEVVTGAGTLAINAQELMYGENLLKYRQAEKSGEAHPMEEKIDIAIQMLEIIKKAHDKGYLHRDIKGLNMIWDKEKKQLKLVDFGLGQPMDQNGQFVSNQLEGTLHIYAPEHLKENLKSMEEGRESRFVYSRETEMYAAAMEMLAQFSNGEFAMETRELFPYTMAIEQMNSGVHPLVAERAADIFGKVPDDPIQARLYDCFKRMLEIDPQKRITFQEAIKELKDIRLEMEIEKKMVEVEDDWDDEEPEPEPEQEVESFNLDSLKELASGLGDIDHFLEANPFEEPVDDEFSALQDITPSDDLQKLGVKIQQLVAEAKTESPQREGRKTLLSVYDTGDKKVLEDLKYLGQMIEQCLGKDSLNTADLLEVSQMVAMMRGRNYAENLRGIDDTQASQHGMVKKFDSFLQEAGDMLVKHLEKTPEYKNSAEQQPQGKNKI